MRKEHLPDLKGKEILQSIHPSPEREFHPVTLQQEGVFLQSMLENDQSIWNATHSWRFDGPLHPEVLREAVKELISRHASLRTNFKLIRDEVVQFVHYDIDMDRFFHFFDVSSCKRGERDAAASRIEKRESAKACDLQRDPLIRFILIRFSEADHLIVIIKHHIIFDVTSRLILWREMVQLYDAFRNSKPSPLEPFYIQYADYATWQQKFVKSEYYRRQKDYWLGQLSDEMPVLELPTDFSRSGKASYNISVIQVNLSTHLTHRLRTFCLRRRVSFSAPFMLAYYILLHKYTGQEDMIIGSLYRGRNVHHQILSQIIGLFANRLPVRMDLGNEDRLEVMLKKVDMKIRHAYQNQDVLHEDLLRTLQPQHSTGVSPLYRVIFNIYNISGTRKDFSGLTRKEWPEVQVDRSIASYYDLSIYVEDHSQKIILKLLYSPDLFREETVLSMSTRYRRLLENILESPETVLVELEIIDDAERRLILYDLNSTERDFPREKTLHRLVEEQVEKSPDSIALRGGGQVSYRYMEDTSIARAECLRSRGVATNDIVGIMVKRTVPMLFNLLGILKAGGVYLPVDTLCPQERIRFMLADSRAELLLTPEQIETIKPESKIQEPLSPSRRRLVEGHERLAYLIYTSGSTGLPKGVLISHRAVVNYLSWAAGLYAGQRRINFPLFTSLAFDLTVTSLFVPLITGNTTVLFPDEDPRVLPNQIAGISDIGAVKVTPSHLQLIRHKESQPSSLRRFIVGGESLTTQLAVDIAAKFEERVDIYNEYGPTEATVGCMIYRFEPKIDMMRETVLIGRPINNIKVYIMDRYRHLQPIGVPGELCVAGAGLALGYLNNPELTAEKFVSFPIRIHKDTTLYRTGDMARFLPDGNVQFLGRIDQQVKIRGFRIEPVEIENKLLKHPNIEGAVVVVRQNKALDKFLCAYYIRSASVSDDILNSTELRAYLGRHLPDYMIPAYFVPVEHIPLATGGKIDCRALPPLPESVPGGIDYESPRNEQQRQLVSIWQEVLGRAKVGIRDNFFLIGGDSIKAIQIASRLATQSWRLDAGWFYRSPTIEDLCRYVENSSCLANQGAFAGFIELIPVQKWFLDRDYTHLHHWNLSVMLYRQEGWNAPYLKEVLQHLTAHHDILRAVLAPDRCGLIIRGVGETDLYFEVKDFTSKREPEKQIETAANRIQSGIDLFSGPLVKFALFKTSQGDHLLMAAHHLIMDGVSWRIIFEDLSLGYRQVLTGDPIRLPPKTHSFKKWFETLKAYSRSDRLLQEFAFWRDNCREGDAVLPGVGNGIDGKIKDYYMYPVELDEEESSPLFHSIHQAYNTDINDILLSGLSLAFGEVFGAGEVMILMEGHGREMISPEIDVSRTVGWFTSLFPVLLKSYREDNLGMHIRRTKEFLRRVPRKGIGYGVLRYLAELPADQRRVLEVRPRISFNYMGRFDENRDEGSWPRSPFSFGESRSPESEQVCQITVNGMAENGRIFFNIRGDRHAVATADVEKLGDLFKNYLQQIIRHCRRITTTIRTPADYGAVELSFEELETIETRFGTENISNIYNLSPMQAGMMFHHLYDPSGGAYTVQLVYELGGEIDLECFQKSYELLIERYEMFRTAFVLQEIGRPLQVVLKAGKGEFDYHDISSGEGRCPLLEDIQRRDRNRDFDLSRDALIRFTLVRTEKRRFTLLINYHHIIMDGWSTNLWLKDFLTIYECLIEGRFPALKEALSYGDYARWLVDQDITAAHQYWRHYLEGIDQATVIEAPEARFQDSERYDQQVHMLQIEESTADRLSAWARSNEATLNNILQGVWSVLLQRYTCIDDVLFGCVISGRNISLQGVEKIVGLFINTIPFRVNLEKQSTFSRMLMHLRENLIESQRFGYLSLAEIREYAAVKGALLDHIYVYENYPLDRGITGPEMSGRLGFRIKRKCSLEHTHYHLYLLILPRQELRLQLVYNGNRYRSEFISKLAGHLENIIQQVAVNPALPLRDIDILPAAERRRIVEEFNLTEADYPAHRAIHEWLEEQVEKSPDYMAIKGRLLVGEDVNLSYREFYNDSLDLAAELQVTGVRTDEIIGLRVERSVEMITGIYGILIAGGAYLPIDPLFPEERVRYILADSGAGMLLKSEDLSHNRNRTGRTSSDAKLFRPQNPRVSSNLNLHIAYIIYTSGTTGRPKGTLIQHHSLVNRLLWMQKKYRLLPHDIILHKTPFTFDVSVWEIFWWSMAGAGIFLPGPGDEKDSGKIVEAVERQRVTVVHFVPSMLRVFLDYLKEKGESQRLSGLRQVIASGESLGISLVKSFKELFRDSQLTELTNLYGPTEATIDVSYFDCPLTNNRKIDRIPIGKPIDNTSLLIIGMHNRLQPVGVTGELCIGGAGLARGYLNRPELTAEKFVRCHKLHTLYRTGDLARLLPDGNIEFMGRIDHQVKIRGIRIELAEIEEQLSRHPRIRESVVVFGRVEEDDTYLAAYIVFSSVEILEPLPGSIELRNYLAGYLPAYMIPAYFIPLEQLPLTANGKLDRHALPGIDSALHSRVEYEPPTDEVEKKLIAICKNILKVDRLGIKDNFFLAGGHSLRAMSLVVEIHREFGVELPLKTIFDLPVMVDLAARIRSARNENLRLDQILGEIEGLSDVQIREI